MSRKEQKRNKNKEHLNLDRRFAISLLLLVFLFFGGVAIYNYKYGPDSSVNLQAVEESLLVKPHSFIKGFASAKITLVEFFDPECESCRAMHWVTKRIEKEYGNQIRTVHRYLPLHSNSRLAAMALEEARAQGKYEEALDVLFEKQPIWGSHSAPRPELITDYLTEIGIDRSRLSQELLFQNHKWKIDLDERDAQRIGVQKTPTFFVNGRMLRGIGYELIKESIDFALKH